MAASSASEYCIICKQKSCEKGKRRYTTLASLQKPNTDITLGYGIQIVFPQIHSQITEIASMNMTCSACYYSVSRLYKLHVDQIKIRKEVQDRSLGERTSEIAGTDELSSLKRERTPMSTPRKKKIKTVNQATSPINSPKKKNVPRKRIDNRRPIKMACEALNRHRYYTALKILNRHCTKKFSSALNLLVQEIMRSEISHFVRCADIFPANLTLSELKHFSWEDVLEEASEKMPTVFACLLATLCNRQQITNTR